MNEGGAGQSLWTLSLAGRVGCRVASGGAGQMYWTPRSTTCGGSGRSLLCLLVWGDDGFQDYPVLLVGHAGCPVALGGGGWLNAAPEDCADVPVGVARRPLGVAGSCLLEEGGGRPYVLKLQLGGREGGPAEVADGRWRGPARPDAVAGAARGLSGLMWRRRPKCAHAAAGGCTDCPLALGGACDGEARRLPVRVWRCVLQEGGAGSIVWTPRVAGRARGRVAFGGAGHFVRTPPLAAFAGRMLCRLGLCFLAGGGAGRYVRLAVLVGRAGCKVILAGACW